MRCRPYNKSYSILKYVTTASQVNAQFEWRLCGIVLKVNCEKQIAPSQTVILRTHGEDNESENGAIDVSAERQKGVNRLEMAKQSRL